ncbi:hypothetical protein KJ359_004794 [Pestalotiopsis sp. 9143b]|nr:hypothetical protein KJ359_004794 [Pestalotiopsis sp. 9143b]
MHEALRGSLFPAAHTYEVAFQFDFSDEPAEGDAWEHVWGGAVHSIYICQELENEEAVAKAKEAKYPWRSLMAGVWHLLSQNRNVKTLVAKDLLPKPTSLFFSRQWSDFLARLEKLEISMWAEDNGAGWMSNTQEGYDDFITRLGQWFFQHATHAQSLVLEAHPDCPFGYFAGHPDISLPLELGQLPELRQLELRNLYVSPDLVLFVCQENSKLDRLVLRNCRANAGEYNNPYRWTRFFDDLTANDKNPLSSCVVQYDKLVSMRKPEPIVARVNIWESPRRMPELEMWYQVPGAIVFDYGSCSDKYGRFDQAFERNYDCFTQGRDLAAFQSLAARIQLNAGSSEGKNTGASYVVLSDELY